MTVAIALPQAYARARAHARARIQRVRVRIAPQACATCARAYERTLARVHAGACGEWVAANNCDPQADANEESGSRQKCNVGEGGDCDVVDMGNTDWESQKTRKIAREAGMVVERPGWNRLG